MPFHKEIIGMPYHIFSPCTLYYWHVKITLYIKPSVSKFMNATTMNFFLIIRSQEDFYEPCRSMSIYIYHNLPSVGSHAHNIVSHKHFISLE